MTQEVRAVVQKCRKGDGKEGKPWCLYTKDGSRLLGAHASKQDAYKQEAAIKHSQAKGEIVAILCEVGVELRNRKSPVAAEVMAAAGDLLEDMKKELDKSGFENPMKRDEDVAEEIRENKIPILPPIDQVAQ